MMRLYRQDIQAAPRGRNNCSDLGFCMRDKLTFPEAKDTKWCRSVHAEANCIISASRRDMIGGTLYLAGRDAKTGELVGDANCCAMCKRLVINAGIEEVIVRRTPTEYEVIPVDKGLKTMNRLRHHGY